MKGKRPSRAKTEPRARLRDLGVAIGRFSPGPNNAITDVAGVRVGHTTIVSGSGPLVPGKGPVRTGVTAVIPASGDTFLNRVFASSYVLNGAGEVTGLLQIEEWGLCETPILLTSTLQVGRVLDAAVAWLSRNHPLIGRGYDVVIPVVAECDDSWLSDAAGRHVSQAHVFAALDGARSGAVAEGTVGAGTGMQTFDFAGGIGTSSRLVELAGATHVVGALVLSNFGERDNLRIDGVPVGRLVAPCFDRLARRGAAGSIIVLVATDVPSSSRQLGRLARRAALALGRTGGYAANNSGEIIVAWSTANQVPRKPPRGRHTIEMVVDTELDPLYEATVDAVDEAIVNAICAGRAVIGQDDHEVPALPLAAVRDAMDRYRPPR